MVRLERRNLGTVRLSGRRKHRQGIVAPCTDSAECERFCPRPSILASTTRRYAFWALLRLCALSLVGTGLDSSSLQVRPMPASCEPPAATQPSRFKSLRDLRQVPSCKRVLGHDQSGYQRLRGRGFALASLRQARHLIVLYLAAAPASFAPLPPPRCLLCVVCWRAALLSHLAFERSFSSVYLCVFFILYFSCTFVAAAWDHGRRQVRAAKTEAMCLCAAKEAQC